MRMSWLSSLLGWLSLFPNRVGILAGFENREGRIFFAVVAVVARGTMLFLELLSRDMTGIRSSEAVTKCDKTILLHRTNVVMSPYRMVGQVVLELLLGVSSTQIVRDAAL